MEITRLGPGDEERYKEIRLRALAESPTAFASTLRNEEAYAPEVWASRLADDRTATLLAVRDGRGVGTSAVRVETPEDAHLLAMWVAPEARGLGVGHRLIEAVADIARDCGTRRLGLWVTESNEHARALYERAGFKPTGERQPLPSHPELMEVRLVREFGDLLADTTPFPHDLDARLREQLRFIVEIDRLKTIVRQSPLAAVERRENDAEHSWHLAMLVMLLAEYADEPIDVGHTLRLVLVHDLVEIYAGDTPLYDDAALAGQRDREVAAAERLFPILPADQADRLRRLWDEFEERRTPEARFAKAMDRLQPLLLSWMARGRTWRAQGTTADKVRLRNSPIQDGSAALWKAARRLIDESEARGWPAPESDAQ